MPDAATVPHAELGVLLVGADGLSITRRSLAAQTLDPARFVVLECASAAEGLAAAGTDYVAFVTTGDTLAPTCLEIMLGAARRDAVVAAQVVESDADGGLDLSPWSRAARTRHDGPDARAAVIRSLAGTLLPTAAARAVPLGTGPASESVFLARLLRGLDLALTDAVHVRVGPPVPPAAELDTIATLTEPDALAARLDVLNEALRRTPEAHADVVAGVEGRGLQLDWSRINRGVARDLAIAYAALPYVDTSGNVAARRIRAAGRVVDVVCADLSAHTGVDESASALWAPWLDTRHELPGPSTLHGDWAPIAAFCRDGLPVIAGVERDKGVYRSVYSRTMFPAAHLLAALYKADHPQTPWVAEFSDPQQRDSRGNPRSSKGTPDAAIVARLSDAFAAAGFVPPPPDSSVWTWAELVAYALADTVLFTNAAQRDYMLGYCADPAYAARAAARAVVEHHPPPPPELYGGSGEPAPELDPAFVHVAYFGTFYPTRSLTEVTGALARLDPATRARLRLHVFTKHPERMQGLDDTLVVSGYLSFADYLAATTSYDVLLLSDYGTAGGGHDVNPYLPAKYSDYAGSGRPIWGVVEPGSVLSGLPLAYRSELGDVDGAAAVLTELVVGRAGA